MVEPNKVIDAELEGIALDSQDELNKFCIALANIQDKGAFNLSSNVAMYIKQRFGAVYNSRDIYNMMRRGKILKEYGIPRLLLWGKYYRTVCDPLATPPYLYFEFSTRCFLGNIKVMIEKQPSGPGRIEVYTDTGEMLPGVGKPASTDKKDIILSGTVTNLQWQVFYEDPGCSRRVCFTDGDGLYSITIRNFDNSVSHYPTIHPRVKLVAVNDAAKKRFEGNAYFEPYTRLAKADALKV
jgi:hypothetical protein